MNSHDPNRHAEPLSPEERALGELLARLGPHGEPSPALDARILAAAHAAVTTPTQARQPTRRWPMALGIAASLTLAVGIAWQLRPVQEAAVYDEAASATAAQAEIATAPQESAASAVAADQARTVPVQPVPEDASTAQAPGSRRESDKALSLPAPRPAAQAERARVPAPAAPPPPEPPVVFDEPAPAEAAMPTAPTAPAAMRAPSPVPAAKATAETRTQAAERNSADAAAVTGTASQSREAAFAEDVPPATADSPEVREAWLQRIRELAKAGSTDDARASLHEFVHRYPNHPLPDDLRALLE